MSLREIIKRLEKATGPDEALDEAIFQAVFGDDPLASPGKRFTGSVDAALKLVPKGYMWELRHGWQVRATVWSVEADYDDHPVPVGYTMDQYAIALCIAALQAHVELEQWSGPRVSQNEAPAHQAKPQKDVSP